MKNWERDIKYAPTYALVIVLAATVALPVVQSALRDSAAASTIRSVILLALQVAGFGAVFVVGKQRAANLGMGRGRLGVGLLFSALLLPVLLIVWWVEGQRYVPQVSVIAHLWVTFGAFVEEIIHRAFIFPQIFLRLREKTNVRRALFVAIAISQTYFGLLHAPRFWTDSAAATALFASIYVLHGIVYVVVYIRTGSIIAAAGCHLLANWGNWLGLRMLAEIVRFFGLLLALAWPCVIRFRTRRTNLHDIRHP